MPDPNKVSLAAFAKLHKKSKQAAAKWKARGHLVMVGALVDVAESDKRLKAAGLGRFSEEVVAPAPAVAVVRNGRQTVEREETAPADDTIDDAEEKARTFVERVLRGEFFTQADAEKFKENALALKHILDGRKKAGELVDAGVAEAIFFEEARAARDAWLNFPTRIGPLLAAELGLEPEKVVEALSAYVHQQLNDLGEPEADFRQVDGKTETGVAEGMDAPATH